METDRVFEPGETCSAFSLVLEGEFLIRESMSGTLKSLTETTCAVPLAPLPAPLSPSAFGLRRSEALIIMDAICSGPERGLELRLFSREWVSLSEGLFLLYSKKKLSVERPPTLLQQLRAILIVLISPRVFPLCHVL